MVGPMKKPRPAKAAPTETLAERAMRLADTEDGRPYDRPAPATPAPNGINLEPTAQGYAHISKVFKAEIEGARKNIAAAESFQEIMDGDAWMGRAIQEFPSDIQTLLGKAMEALIERETERIAHFEGGANEIDAFLAAGGPKP